MQDLFYLVLTAVVFALLIALVKGTELLRKGAGDE